ncbi:GNAT family N-acetyltransferase [Chromobacterium subtsugae]|uniref:GNAT family N-acetyltransferase n=1 Tax=Chromobacterium subtsugae TaxID=251747 RepID=A0ABS7FBT0_9NEIS|nr:MULTISPECIES: GNAT family protein [Chromobacterium]KUM03225.1 hypothetical protein Cv017_20605 [Chromobacterium subtsugae]KZE85890.1 hypothetical protein AWB61_17770 [Chromobacterium sp. F49]MBW7567260.1 GNAT family N-acetyltransferase [Chromobacterium subtsugae]MBW8287426.1 GNAT family N-acetyltransferase [Chromobacterium subtsugae]WSE93385.1 GNAT family protein [Chromobacterium subtsugae]
MHIVLETIPPDELADIEKSATPRRLAGRVAEQALPPPEVAARAREHLQAGQRPYWCLPFYMLDGEGRVVGACGFKGEPRAGRVEIGYAVAPACRRQGAAAAAVRLLLQRARDSGEVAEVLAQVNPENQPSLAVVGKLGFLRGGVLVDEDDEPLLQWVWPVCGGMV